MKQFLILIIGVVTSRIQKSTKRSVESYSYLHVIVLTLGFDVWK